MFKVLCSGVGIGVANLIPGVSGATIAVLTNQYGRIINECHRLLAFQFKQINYGYVIIIFGGAVLGVGLGAIPLHYVMHYYSGVAFCVIAGLILGSIPFVAISTQPMPVKNYLYQPLFYLGAILILALVFFESEGWAVSFESSTLGWFISGVVAMGAMIIPGVSGSMILIMVGTYTPILGAIKAMAIMQLLPFVGGAALGGILSVKGIHWAVKAAPNHVQSMVIGLLLGSVVFMVARSPVPLWQGGVIIVVMAWVSYKISSYGHR
jgi:putative membrane protein